MRRYTEGDPHPSVWSHYLFEWVRYVGPFKLKYTTRCYQCGMSRFGGGFFLAVGFKLAHTMLIFDLLDSEFIITWGKYAKRQDDSSDARSESGR